MLPCQYFLLYNSGLQGRRHPLLPLGFSPLSLGAGKCAHNFNIQTPSMSLNDARAGSADPQSSQKCLQILKLFMSLGITCLSANVWAWENISFFIHLCSGSAHVHLFIQAYPLLFLYRGISRNNSSSLRSFFNDSSFCCFCKVVWLVAWHLENPHRRNQTVYTAFIFHLIVRCLSNQPNSVRQLSYRIPVSEMMIEFQVP